MNASPAGAARGGHEAGEGGKMNRRRLFIGGSLWFMFHAQQQMVAPKVERKTRTETQVYEQVTRSCPAGYEGHFVDTQTGFGDEYWVTNGSGLVLESSPGYTVCFKREFMDEIRKNPDLLARRPAPPRPI